ncbi:HPF/RaiA family ribosome-associated protein [uncultured Croceitalea sp.]|uniref:HPF/RaiA family ribosome-associated protein n=1 Tax=uncultured Croceitalea sp. TaxID=1798908 RepID=UPI003305B146
MQVTFEYNGVRSSERLEQKILKKLNKLVAKYDFIVRASVYLRAVHSHYPFAGKVCNIKLSVPGPFLFAESNTDNFENSLQHSIEELEQQLARKKGKFARH